MSQEQKAGGDEVAVAKAPEVGQVWQRNPPQKQRLRVMRVFIAGRGLIWDEPELEGQPVVALIPRNGGRDVLLTVAELHEHCTLVEAPA